VSERQKWNEVNGKEIKLFYSPLKISEAHSMNFLFPPPLALYSKFSISLEKISIYQIYSFVKHNGKSSSNVPHIPKQMLMKNENRKPFHILYRLSVIVSTPAIVVE
jgi:hypothetical protein